MRKQYKMGRNCAQCPEEELNYRRQVEMCPSREIELHNFIVTDGGKRASLHEILAPAYIVPSIHANPSRPELSISRMRYMMDSLFHYFLIVRNQLILPKKKKKNCEIKV